MAEDTPLDDKRFNLEVLDRILKVKDQRAKLLGTYAPTRVESITIDSVEAEIERLQKELAATPAIPAIEGVPAAEDD